MENTQPANRKKLWGVREVAVTLGIPAFTLRYLVERHACPCYVFRGSLAFGFEEVRTLYHTWSALTPEDRRAAMLAKQLHAEQRLRDERD